jgi:hypothetical protein
MRPGPEIKSERDIFEFDRRALVVKLNALRLTVRRALTEIAMVAAESVFNKPLSAKLRRKARALEHMTLRLDELDKVLARSRVPRIKK